MARNKFLQLAFNHTFGDFKRLIGEIPFDESIVIEAGTPLIKREGIGVVNRIKYFWPGRVCADIKIVDGAKQEVEMAAEVGADYVTATGTASEETLRIFVESCRENKITSVIDMINTSNPLQALWKANTVPDAVLIHRGRDEENSFGEVIQYKNIAKIKGKWDIMVGAAGGIDKKEMSSAIFNGADIVVVNIVHESDPWSGIVVDADFHDQVLEFLRHIK